MDDESTLVYLVRLGAEGYEVRSETGSVVLLCGDEGSAKQYALLLNQAYRFGFKAGFRAARRG